MVRRNSAILLPLLLLVAPVSLAQESLFLIGDADRLEELSRGAQGAYERVLAQEKPRAEYIPFRSLEERIDSDVGRPDAIWWHETGEWELPDVAKDEELIESLRHYLHRGGGLLLTGFAPQYVTFLGVEDTAPTSVFREPGHSGRWGFWPQCPQNPVFKGLPQPFFTMAEGVPVENILCWWDHPHEFDGRWLADNEGRIGRVAVGEYRLGAGRVVVVGSGAFDWRVGSAENAHYENLAQFTDNLLSYVGRPYDGPTPDAGLRAWWRFEGEGEVAVDDASGMEDSITARDGYLVRAEGPRGQALYIDGYSSWVTRSAECAPLLHRQVSLAGWVGLGSYPTEDAPVFSQRSDQAGFWFGLTPRGEWGFRVCIEGSWQSIWAPELFPLNRWTHVAATLEPGKLRLYLDGEVIAEQTVRQGFITQAREEELHLGRDNILPLLVDIFPLRVLHGFVDDLRIYDRAISDSDVLRLARPAPASSALPFDVYQRLLLEDPHRPVYHAMPPTSWTNEPHGLVQTPTGRFHMFYQKNPNGPYWSRIKWGNMSSDDLVHWEDHPISIRPSELFDRDGCWSGDAEIMESGRIRLLYSGVGAGSACLAYAEATNDSNTEFVKIAENPIIEAPPRGEPFMDFRDPFVFDREGSRYLVIGSGVPNIGGAGLLYKRHGTRGYEFLGTMMRGKRASSGFFWEMPIALDLGEKWLFGVTEMPGRNSYWWGTWEGETFVPASPDPIRLEIINHFLSPTVTRDRQGRTIAIGIIPETRSSEQQFQAGWAHVYSIPRIWTLEDGQLHQRPLPELEKLRDEHFAMENFEVHDGTELSLEGVTGSALEILLEADMDGVDRLGIKVRRSPDGAEETSIIFDRAANRFILDRTRSSLDPETERDVQEGPFELREGEPLHLHLFVDQSVLEVFANDRGTFTTRIYPTLADSDGVSIFAEGGVARVNRIDAWTMKSIWP